MNRTDVIALAEELGLLINDEERPYSMPAHQRLISRLEKFATRVERETMEKYMEKLDRLNALERQTELTKEIGQEL